MRAISFLTPLGADFGVQASNLSTRDHAVPGFSAGSAKPNRQLVSI
jgi:hypothetical protein